MNVEKVKSVDELFQEVNDYDLVFTSDPALADALNNRLEKAIIGHFATTPLIYTLKHQQNENPIQKREVFLETIKQTDLTWKQISYYLENIIDCWKETGDPENILSYEAWNNEATKTLIQIMQSSNTVYSKMQELEIDSDQEVAVVNPHQLDKLDKHVVPDDADQFTVFTDEEFEMPELRILNSATEIIETTIKATKQFDPQDIAIVTDPESKYGKLVESRLEAEDIPYMVQRSMDENQDLRTFLRYLKTCLSNNRLRVRDCKPVLRQLGINIKAKHDNDYIVDLELDEIEEFLEIASETEGSCLEEALDAYSELTETEVSEIKQEFEKIQALDQEVNFDLINSIEYYLTAFDIPMSSEGRGALLASAKSSSYVDRPIVLYLGLDSSWNSSVSDRPWTNKQSNEETLLKNFKTLIQNGENQYYLVQETEVNKTVNPCIYLNQISEENIEKFSELPSTKHHTSIENSSNGFEHQRTDEPNLREIKTISQSSLNRLVYCPKDYMFDRLVDSTDAEPLRKGTLYHDFAEFYFNHPEFVNERGVDFFVDWILDRMKSIVDDLQLDILETEIRTGLNNLISYLDQREPEIENLDRFKPTENENKFAKYFDKKVETTITEAQFENFDLGINGKADLILSKNHMVDYKSSTSSNPKNKSATKVVKDSKLDDIESEPNYQAKLYLLALRAQNSDSILHFTFYRFLSDLDDQISDGKETIGEKVEITYYPKKFNDSLPLKEVYDFLYSSNDRRKLLDPLGFETYRDVMSGFCISDQSIKDEFPTEQDVKQLEELCRPHLEIGRGKDVTENQLNTACESILKKLIGSTRSQSLIKQCYFKEDLDEFEGFLQKQLENLNNYRTDAFPLGETDLEDVQHRDMIIDERAK